MHFIAKPKVIKSKLIKWFPNRLCKASYQRCFQKVFSVTWISVWFFTMSFFNQLPFLNSTSFKKSTVVLRIYNTQQNTIGIKTWNITQITVHCSLNENISFVYYWHQNLVCRKNLKNCITWNLVFYCQGALKKIPNVTQNFSIQRKNIENKESTWMFKIVYSKRCEFLKSCTVQVVLLRKNRIQKFDRPKLFGTFLLTIETWFERCI